MQEFCWYKEFRVNTLPFQHITKTYSVFAGDDNLQANFCLKEVAFNRNICVGNEGVFKGSVTLDSCAKLNIWKFLTSYLYLGCYCRFHQPVVSLLFKSTLPFCCGNRKVMHVLSLFIFTSSKKRKNLRENRE